MSASFSKTKSTEKVTYKKMFSFQDSSLPNTYRQDTSAPFVLTLMSIHPSDMKESVVSAFTPRMQFNLPISKIKLPHNSMHQHNYFEFNYVLKGKMYLIVNGKRHLYTAGSCCLMNRDTPHTELPESSDYLCIFFSVSRDFIKRLMNYGNSLMFCEEQGIFENVVFQFFKGNLQDKHPNKKDFWDFVPLITEIEQKKIVHNIFEDMVYLMLNPRPGSTYLLQCLFLQLIDILCNPNCYNTVYVTSRSSMDSLIFARIDQLLYEHCGRICNSELSRLLNYDGSYLGKIVKKHTGKSLFQYSMTFTMAAAADLLTNSEMTVSEIAAKLKFSNRAHFYKLFEEHFGVTPKAYRQNKRDSAQFL